jgi:hypothetical protein
MAVMSLLSTLNASKKMDYQKQFQSVFVGIDLASKPDICTPQSQCPVCSFKPQYTKCTLDKDHRTATMVNAADAPPVGTLCTCGGANL